MIFGLLNPEKIWHENLTGLSISAVRSTYFTLGNPKKVIFHSIIHTYFWLFMLSHKKTNCNPLAHSTWKCHHTNLGIAKLFHLTEGLLRSFRRWGLWKEPIVICGNWNVSQAMLQQVFRLTTFCIKTCLESFSTLISRIVHHGVLKFSPYRNKPLPQASTYPYQYTCSSCSVPQTQY